MRGWTFVIFFDLLQIAIFVWPQTTDGPARTLHQKLTIGSLFLFCFLANCVILCVSTGAYWCFYKIRCVWKEFQQERELNTKARLLMELVRNSEASITTNDLESAKYIAKLFHDFTIPPVYAK